MSIKDSVGKKSRNNGTDVKYVQTLLNFHIECNPRMRKIALLAPSVSTMDVTITAIGIFQYDIVKIKSEAKRGRVEPGSPTIKALEGYPEFTECAPVPETLAPLEVRTGHRIRQAFYSDDFDHNCDLALSAEAHGKRKKMFGMLAEPGVDDSFLDADAVSKYVARTPVTPIKAYRLIPTLGAMGSKTSRGLLEDFDKVFDSIVRGFSQAAKELEGLSMMKSRTLEESFKFQAPVGSTELIDALTNLQNWYEARAKDPNSIYSAFGLVEPAGHVVEQMRDGFLSWFQ